MLGGGDFVGRAVVEEALAAGQHVTTLSRTRAREGVDARHGDRRTDGLEALGDERWDTIVDTWSWEPRVVTESAARLADRADRYVYISTQSVYAYPRPALADESAPTVDADPADDVLDDYARTKRGAELGVLAGFGDRAVLVRPGLILGPHENIGRLPWWLGRLARGGEIVAPGPADGTFQYVDARDLARFSLADIEPGAYNVTNPAGATTMGELLQRGLEATVSGGTLRWVAPETLLAAGVEPWTNLPIWIPEGEGHVTMHEGGTAAAFAAGLSIRPLRETVDDTWAWLQSIGGVAPQRRDRPSLGLDPELESQILRA